MAKISLKAARVNSEMTIRNVADQMNVSERTVINWESGLTDMSATTFLKLCDLYGFKPSDIFLPKTSTKSV